jgi:hypothetical protein
MNWHTVHGDHALAGDLVKILNPMGEDVGIIGMVLRAFDKDNTMLGTGPTRMVMVKFLRYGEDHEMKACYVRIISRAWGNTRGLSTYSLNNSEDLKKS